MTEPAVAHARVAQLAERLFVAEQEGQTLEPISSSQVLLLEDAYRVQQALIDKKLAARIDERWKGLKAGLTSLAKQRMVNIHEPILGQLLYSNIVTGRQVSLQGLSQPRVEPEIALFFGRKVRGEIRQATLLAALEYAFPALEILDSRFAGYKFQIADVVADNASTARVVLGDRLFPVSADLAQKGVSLFINGVARETGCAAAVLGDPIASALWVVQKWVGLGNSLPAGAILLTGGITTAVPIAIGDTVVGTFAGWGEVQFHCG
ncbi:MAG: 4-oxalocrotonate decarboxylase [Acidobacteria bacterium]|nr:4-oxalocrotonate decarboxylase [Acidobacteriota bacterium]